MRLLASDYIRAVLANAGYGNADIRLADNTYAAPTRDWLTGDFYGWFQAVLFAFSCTRYKPESEDCDDFADLFSTFARICHRRTSPDCGAALPVGILWYQSPMGYHAVNIALTSDHGLVVIEPQNGNVLTLTPEQVASAQLIKL